MIINGESLLALAPIKDMIPSKERIHGLSYGLSEAGYDFRIKQKVVFTAPNPHILLDIMKKIWTTGIHYEITPEDQYAIYGSTQVFEDDGTVTTTVGRTAKGSSVEYFQIPTGYYAEFRNKSTHARRFLDASLGTDGEPGWNGFLTIEMAFHENRDYTIEAGSPILKAVFAELSDRTEYSGKYNNQPNRPVEAIFE